MSGETKWERMSLTKVDRDNLRETARTKYSLEPDGSCGNRLAHASRDVLVLLDALEEMEEARDINVATNIELIKQHAEVEEKLKAQLATAQETIERLRKGNTLLLDTNGELRLRLKGMPTTIVEDDLESDLSALRTTHEKTVEALKVITKYVEDSARESFATSLETFEDDFMVEDPEGYAAYKQAQRAIGEGKGEG